MKKATPLRWIVALLLIIGIAGFAWSRVGMLDLPAVPSGLTMEASGLTGLDEMKRLNDWIWSTESGPTTASTADPQRPPSEGATWVRQGIAAYQRAKGKKDYRVDDIAAALEDMRRGIRLAPDSLVLTNAYRTVAFRERRDYLALAHRQSMLAPQFPPVLDRQPIAFFEELGKTHGTREVRLNLALAWVDEMLLFPALEIKAPSSVQAVDILTDVIENGNPGYIPALLGRGLNYLHRPSRLVWPESIKTAPDAAVLDIGRCVAIGRRFATGSPRVHATLALMLGDAYVKAGRFNVARSWWQIAQNLCRDGDLQADIRRRYGWSDEEILDRLDEELDRSRNELEHRMTDLAWVWN